MNDQVLKVCKVVAYAKLPLEMQEITLKSYDQDMMTL